MRLALMFTLIAAPVHADSLVATRPIAAQTVISADDFTAVPADIPAALTDAQTAIGQQARVMIAAGQPLRAANLGPPILIERNQIVTLRYSRGPLVVEVAGRALGNGAAGQRVRVLNLSSKSTVTGQIAPDQTIYVTPEVP